MKKIALIGTHSVGKTTTLYGLAHELKKLRYNVDVLKETARECPLPINQKASVDAQKWILGKQLCIESTINKTVDFALCDRTLFDIFIYSQSCNNNLANAMWNFVYYHMKTYDAVFFLPIRREYFKADGQRDKDESWQIQINQKFEFF